jgi:hypothetical protein
MGAKHMLLITYIENHYGNKRGNKANFLRDNPDILPQELSRWIKTGLKVNLTTGEIYKPASKTINIKKGSIAKMGGFSTETAMKLEACAKQAHMSIDQLINYLLDNEIERTQILNDRKNSTSYDSNTPVQAITEIINRHFSSLSRNSEISEFRTVFRALMNELLEKQIINIQVPVHMIAESQHLPIPRTDYYWYGGIVADRTAKMLGALEVYLWHELLFPESEVIFLGAPNNVVACNFICERVCKLLKQIKSNYKKTQGGWGNKREIEESANQYIYQFAQGIIEPQLYIYDEDSQMRLINHAIKHYDYAMD